MPVEGPRDHSQAGVQAPLLAERAGYAHPYYLRISLTGEPATTLASIESLEITRVNVTALFGKVTGIRWGARA